VKERVITSQTQLIDVLNASPSIMWVYRDAEVGFELYDEEGLVIYRYSKEGSLLWSGSVRARPFDRVIDLLRDARETAQLQARERGR
jgi:hypothetical protein